MPTKDEDLLERAAAATERLDKTIQSMQALGSAFGSIKNLMRIGKVSIETVNRTKKRMYVEALEEIAAAGDEIRNQLKIMTGSVATLGKVVCDL